MHKALKSNPNGYVTKGVCMCAFVYVCRVSVYMCEV